MFDILSVREGAIDAVFGMPVVGLYLCVLYSFSLWVILTKSLPLLLGATFEDFVLVRVV